MVAILAARGYSPREISALVNAETISVHAEEAAFLWTMRSRAVDEPHYALKDLSALDERVQAHLAGLRIAGDVGWSACQRTADESGPGEVFALAVLAFGGDDTRRMRDALLAGCRSAAGARALVSALGWLRRPALAKWLDALRQAPLADHRLVGLAAALLRREDPGSALARALADDDLRLRRCALRVVGELKRDEYLGQAWAHLDHADAGCRFQAARSLTLLGEPAGVAALEPFCAVTNPRVRDALQLVLRAVDRAHGRDKVRALSARPESATLAVFAIGVLGDPTAVPWLIDRMAVPALARSAGESFSMITGVDLEYHDLDRPAAAVADDAHATDGADAELPCPDPQRVASYWESTRGNYQADARYLCGAPVSRGTALHVLRTGKQRQRHAAALECALLDRHRPLFETRLRGSLQEASLAQWNS